MFENNQLQQTITERLLLAVIMLALVALVLLVLGTSPVAQAAAITANSADNTVADDGICTLQEAITAANTDTALGVTPGECAVGSGADSIKLGLALIYLLDEVDNFFEGENGLPSISTDITINGGSSTIARSVEVGTPEFRFLYVEASRDLKLNDLTLTSGSAQDSNGEAIRSVGSITITNSALTGNTAVRGGAINNDGTLTLVDSTIRNNPGARSGGGIINNGVASSV